MERKNSKNTNQNNKIDKISKSIDEVKKKLDYQSKYIIENNKINRIDKGIDEIKKKIDHQGKYISENNKINKIDKSVDQIKEKIDHQNKFKIKNKYVDINILTLMVSIATLFVSFMAMYTSNKISTNNSALNFTYENIDVIGMDATKDLTFKGFEIISSPYLGGGEIQIDIKVLSGQIKSLYLVEKRDNDFIFYLLNDKVQDKFSKIKRYKTKKFFGMNKIAEYKTDNEHDPLLIGVAQLYILSVDANDKINIDTIQVIGTIITKLENKEIMIYGADFEYTFRYLKNNKLITLNDINNIDEGWVNLSNKYLDLVKETNFTDIEDDIAMIKEKFSRY